MRVWLGVLLAVLAAGGTARLLRRVPDLADAGAVRRDVADPPHRTLRQPHPAVTGPTPGESLARDTGQ